MSLHRRAIRSLAWVFLSLVAWAALAAGVARANELDHVFEEGNRAYAEGRFADALASYQRLLDHGVRDPAVLMNAGNACYRLERFAEARLAWERALRRAPGDRDLGENLGLAVKALGLEALPAPSWPERTFVAVLGVASADGWGCWRWPPGSGSTPRSDGAG
ncbi:MAG: tetratricopeptide repeat protein [Deltaproteobacteria bacterium]|nr:tetratricopeptide repeat protein [Deltaproteobacteria bacterium]